MIYIDPSELRETSNLLRYISDVVYKPLPNLEALTGADVMISPQSMPLPRNDKLILSHIKGGAKLLQLKFGHDLSSSITDDRLKEAQSRMLATGANPWQCGLVFIGLMGYDTTKGMATINGQLTYGNRPLEWFIVDINQLAWIDRGGFFYPLSTGKVIPLHFNNIQNMVDGYTSHKAVRKYFPKAPAFYHEVESSNPTMREWGVGQKLEAIDDLRSLIRSIPVARKSIGPERATAIWDWMKDNGVRQDLAGFVEIVNNKKILEVPGIGQGIYDKICWGLWATYEERKRNGIK